GGGDAADAVTDTATAEDGGADTVIDTADAADTGAVDSEEPDAADTVEVDTVTLPGFALTCGVDGDCESPCGDGRCVDGRCRYAAPASGCVVPLDIAEAPDRAECVAAGSASPAVACLRCDPQIVAEGYTGLLLARDFDDGQLGLTVEKLADTPATWAVSARRASSAGGLSLHFGQPQGGYGVGARAAARATTAPIAVPAGATPTLAFEVWLDTEETPGFDLMTVAVDRGGDAEPVVLWTSDELGGTTHGEFLPVTLDLQGVAVDGMQILFEFDTFDGIINDFEGAYVDTLRVTSGCCGGEADCFDANPCTLDRCEAGACSHEEVAGCCLDARDCDDGDACTKDACSAVGGQCSATPIAGCCHAQADCDDGDPCTEDSCPGDGGTCRHQPLCCEQDLDCTPGVACMAGACVGGQCRYTVACCEADGECDDGDACTADRCGEGGVCAHDFTAGPGCCRPDVLTERFDAGTPAGWTFDAAVANIGWHVQASGEARSGTSTLYYGHPALFYYDTGGRNQGSATSQSVRLPNAVEVFLTLSALLDVETAADRDLVRIDAVVGNTVVPLFSKADLAVGAWQTVTKDVSFFAGQVVRFRVSFDSVDGLRNSTKGVFIDDLRVWSSCRPRPCETSP
ncbi:MAG: hypothetical protein KC635_20775, partial [Myxococcales bacterium]|nr:hypothetical protein [Myxococcales bacterium]